MINWFKRRGKSQSSYRTNDEWVQELSPPPSERAVADLRDQLIKGLRPALHKYVDRELNQFVEDTAQDALIKILDKVDTFRGESRFVTWAMKVAVRQGLSELRRKKWNDISLNDLAHQSDDEDPGEISHESFTSATLSPDEDTHQQIVVKEVMNIIENELSDKQKKAIQGVVVHGMGSTVVADQLGVSRNALYKLIYDARKSIKQKMMEKGLDADNILEQM